MVDAVVSTVLERLLGLLGEGGRIVLEYQDQFELMQTQLRLIQGFLRDADRRRRKVHTLRAITDELREVIYEAEDIMAACTNAGLQATTWAGSCLPPCASLAKFPSLFQTGRQLREINSKIRQITERLMPFSSQALALSNSRDEFTSDVGRWSSPVLDQTKIVGLEREVAKIKGWLFGANSGVTTMGIVGMGGLGKTTAAQKVFGDKEVEDHFQKILWVSVSQTFREEEIMRSILKNLGDAGIGDDRSELLRKIHQYLQGKHYLIVFDDVWSVQSGWWERLSNGLPKENKSCIIITTRNEEVARRMGAVEGRIHRPSLLSMEDSWSLFCKAASGGADNISSDPRLREVGMEIVQKCGGLPLAIRAVGGMMFCLPSSVAEWRRIADNFRDELAQNDDLVMASLQLSYDELPGYLKPCFLCFAIYPEDRVIFKDQLVHWWMGEGFVPNNSGGGLSIESGEDCFMGLLNRCLVEAVDRSYNGKVQTCKIHDMVRDLVIKIAKEEAFCQLQNGRHRRLGIPASIPKLHLNSDSKLRALVSTTNKQEVNKVKSTITAKICDCRNLRVLDFSETIFKVDVKDVLHKISSMPYLTYLNLRNTHLMTEVPESIGKLRNLQILDLSFCHILRTLPASIVTLEKLIVLDVSGCDSLRYMPKGLNQLSNLQVLKGFRPSRTDCANGCHIGELKCLNQLKTLELLLSRGDEIADGDLEAISHLQKLQNLTISFIDSYGADLSPKLELLHLPQQISELTLKFFPGEATPNWLNPISLPELQYLCILHGSFRHFGIEFWGDGSTVWRLLSLELELLPSLEADWVRVHQAMPSLRLVSASWCPKLEGFPITDISFKGGVWRRDEMSS
ncbi:hypothetical protein Taro_038408 [Colocasia esculenta]|uniref:Uncharacterized protein n=1 Tax=Colocasia esculenta TaxID=4460 RepID=A0A843WFS8_COLES|nr:hypothetical protein [Colocasia esculenta]